MPCKTVGIDWLVGTSSLTQVSDCSASLKETKEKVETETMLQRWAYSKKVSINVYSFGFFKSLS